MIYAIYRKLKPNSKWRLMSVAISAEAAITEIEEVKKLAAEQYQDEAIVATQLFDSQFWIPEFMEELKDQKPVFN